MFFFEKKNQETILLEMIIIVRQVSAALPLTSARDDGALHHR
jgi:hypothetical protein